MYDDAERLALCLDALKRQSYPCDRFDVVVVDNDGGDGPSKYAQSVAEFGPRAEIVREAAPGSYAARNAGLAAARGELIAFTDADCRPTASWLSEGVARWRTLPRASVIGGAVQLVARPRPSLIERCEILLLGFPQDVFVNSEHFAATANAFAGREVFDRIGAFDARLRSGGDYEWGRRAWAAGVPVVFEPNALIEHPARRGVVELAQKLLRMAGGRWGLRRGRDGWGVGASIRWEIYRFLGFRAKLANLSKVAPVPKRRRLVLLVGLLQALCIMENIRLALGARGIRR